MEAVKSLITAGADMNVRDRVRPQSSCGGIIIYIS